MSHRRARNVPADAPTDPNDRDMSAASGAEEDDTPELDTSALGAVERLLSHAEGHGEVYTGAIADLQTVRAAIADGRITIADA